MAKVWKIEITAFNGTVTAWNEVSLYSTKELAEKTLQCVRAENMKNKDYPFRIVYKGPTEIDVYTKESDVPFFNKQDYHS